MMGLMSAITRSVLTRLFNFTAAGVTTLTSPAVDSTNFDIIEFEVGLGPVVDGGTTVIDIHGSTVDSGYARLAGCRYTLLDADDNKIVRIQIVRPKYRFMKLVITRATQNVTVDYGVVRKWNGRTEPVTQDTSVTTAMNVISPELF